MKSRTNMTYKELRAHVKPYIVYLFSFPAKYFFTESHILSMGVESFRENYKFEVVRRLATEELFDGTGGRIEEQNRKRPLTTVHVALDIVKDEIAYGEKLMRLFVHDFEDVRSEYPGDEYRQLVLRKVLDRDCGIDNGKYSDLLADSQIYDDITICINYLKGINPDGRKFPATLKDMNERMVDESFRTVLEDVSGMRAYIECLNNDSLKAL